MPKPKAAYSLSQIALGVTVGNLMFSSSSPVSAYVPARVGLGWSLLACACAGPVFTSFTAAIPVLARGGLVLVLVSSLVFSVLVAASFSLAGYGALADVVSLQVVQRLVLAGSANLLALGVSLAVSMAIWPKPRWPVDDGG
jgi:hypothetical protein